jgi:hypothetical protein
MSNDLGEIFQLSGLPSIMVHCMRKEEGGELSTAHVSSLTKHCSVLHLSSLHF